MMTRVDRAGRRVGEGGGGRLEEGAWRGMTVREGGRVGVSYEEGRSYICYTLCTYILYDMC